MTGVMQSVSETDNTVVPRKPLARDGVDALLWIDLDRWSMAAVERNRSFVSETERSGDDVIHDSSLSLLD
jgi:hypothetical protein